MKILKPFFIAFSIYSKIPVPQFDWKEEDMRYHLCFFPWIGVVIGLLEVLWFWAGAKCGVSPICKTLVGTALPLIVTGGFHLDGFMDTMDAFHSYQDREKKLEILKDPHIGAFSVLMLVLYYLIYGAAFSELDKLNLVLILGIGFALSRSLSGIAVVCFPTAKKDGMLAYFASSAQKRWVLGVLIAQTIVFCGAMICTDWLIGLVTVLGAMGSFGYYFYRSKKEFGGINGDTAGYFVSMCENVMVVVIAIMSHVILL